MPQHVNIYQAKTRLSALVDEVAKGAEVIIAKNGVPVARLSPYAKKPPRKPSGLLTIRRIAPDFDAPDPELARAFDGEV